MDEEEISGRCTPKELIDLAKSAAQDLLPSSRERYNTRYAAFKKWLTWKKCTSISQTVLLAYFNELSRKHKPTTLWAFWSMLKATIRAYDNIDIGSYSQLLAFLKAKAKGYSSVKASVFSLADIQKFVDTAPDELWLDVKVVCIFAVSGACNSNELPGIKLKDIENRGEELRVRIQASKTTKTPRSFSITGTVLHVVQKYVALRFSHITEERFFINYQRGKCTNQPIGKHKFSQMPRRVAKYLKLPEPNSYTGNSFRRTSLSLRETSTNVFKNGSNTAVNGATSSSVTSENVSMVEDQTYNCSGNSVNGANTKTNPRTDAANQSNRKFGEIYCSPMGVLSYHCTLCPAQMSHNDDFNVHYMTHFRDAFPIKQELQPEDPKILVTYYEISEQIDPISTIKVEETQIKSEPSFSYDDDDDDESGTCDSFILS